MPATVKRNRLDKCSFGRALCFDVMESMVYGARDASIWSREHCSGFSVFHFVFVFYYLNVKRDCAGKLFRRTTSSFCFCPDIVKFDELCHNAHECNE